MPKYFFDYRQGRDICRDESGMEFNDAEHAYLSAFEAATSMWSELLRERRDPRICSFEVTDELRQPIFTLPFSEVLDSCRKTGSALESHARGFHNLLATRRYTQRCFNDLRHELDVTRAALCEAKALIAAAEELENLWGGTAAPPAEIAR
jgi:hypothetical protein